MGKWCSPLRPPRESRPEHVAVSRCSLIECGIPVRTVVTAEICRRAKEFGEVASDRRVPPVEIACARQFTLFSAARKFTRERGAARGDALQRIPAKHFDVGPILSCHRYAEGHHDWELQSQVVHSSSRWCLGGLYIADACD